MAKYVKFHPDLWTTVFNYEAIGIVTSLSNTALKVTGHFRTEADYVGLGFSSRDFWNHDYVKYATETSYKGVSLSFVPSYKGKLAKYNDTEQQPAMVIRYGEKGEDDSYFVTMGMFGVKNSGHTSLSFNGKITLPNTWIDLGSVSLSWSKTYTDYTTDKDGNNIETTRTETGVGVEGKDFDLDYVRGIFYTTDGSIPYEASCSVSYTYNTHQRYDIDFDRLYEGVHPDLRRNAPTENIYSITIPVIPDYFIPGDLVMTGRSDAFELTLSNMKTVGGDLNEVPVPLPKVPYRLAEGFDDEYNKNPKRLIESMRLLGYEKIINLYIGASHFYDKKGTAGAISKGVGDIYLDPTKGINDSFRTWLISYLHHMKLNGFNEFVTSVSMECLQMPEEWKQRLWNGQAGATGWNPPTNFYSPNNDAVKVYIDKITCEVLDIVVSQGFQPILQLGESWYWWQEFQPGNVEAPYEGRPPAIYDADTKARFKKEMGYDIPIYKSSDISMTWKHVEVAEKLQQYLGEYTIFMSGIADKYPNSLFTTLFFPPSVLDKSRTPAFMQIVNAPFEYWKYPKLDFIQVEDYDWVTTENENHMDVFTEPWYDMGYPFSKQHYFSGFVLKHENASKEWPLVERAGQEALGRRYAEVFIWAGTQIRRDGWLPKLNVVVSDTEQWQAVNMEYVPTE